GTYGCVDGQPAILWEHGTEILRPGVGELLTALSRTFVTYLLSGDHPPRTDRWTKYFVHQRLFFRQSPFEKQQRVTDCQEAGAAVLMLGDGLNDTGALAEASVGLAVSEDEARFSPACDGILAADKVGNLGSVLTVARRAKTVLFVAYGLAFLYNLIGLTYAVTGTLSPVVAAILMPLSSLTIVVVGVVGATLVFRSADFREITEPLPDPAPAASPT
ncbi:MAG: HAD-IC family P-type ATPase, partial [Bacteroidota bacterium]